jgi:hypothetical protein
MSRQSSNLAIGLLVRTASTSPPVLAQSGQLSSMTYLEQPSAIVTAAACKTVNGESTLTGVWMTRF